MAVINVWFSIYCCQIFGTWLSTVFEMVSAREAKDRRQLLVIGVFVVNFSRDRKNNLNLIPGSTCTVSVRQLIPSGGASMGPLISYDIISRSRKRRLGLASNQSRSLLQAQASRNHAAQRTSAIGIGVSARY